MADRDPVDELIEQWRRERPDLDLAPMATIGRMGRVMARLGASIEACFARHGLTTGDFDVLAALRRAGAPHVLRPTDLARQLMLSPAGMTNRLDRLEAAGMVERRPDPDDRRSWLITLSAKGLEVVDAAVTEHVANEAALLEPLTASQRKALDAALRALLASVEPPA
ncbi:MAG: MarR family winged helix-turn-helix transcriptional regulator [Acidimicrobiia bacterium]